MASNELRIPADVRHVGRSRRWVRHHAPSDASPESLRVLELLTSEVVTNAVKYGRCDEVVVRLGLRRDVVEVVVLDANPEPPLLIGPSQHRDGGRGMLLVDSLAREWGVERHEADGKSVWFCVPTSALVPA